MKKSECPRTPYDKIKDFCQKTAEGATLGAVVVTGLTPIFNMTNCAIHQKKFLLRNGMIGWKEYVMAVGQETAVSYAFYSLFSNAMRNKEDPLRDSQKILASSAAGAIAGILDTPAEMVAQTKQIMGKNANTLDVVKEICAKNGVSGLWRGNAMVMTREATWATVFLSLTPIISDLCQKKMGLTKTYANLIAAIVAGSAFGLISTPIKVLQFEQQNGLTTTKTKESYLSIVKRNGVDGLSRGLKYRFFSTILAAVAFTEGKELLEYTKKSLGIQ